MRVSFNEYQERYKRFAAMRREDAILEVRLHTNGAHCVFDGGMHAEFGDMFDDIGADRENRVVILTATGDRFMLTSDMDMSVMEQYLPYTAAMHLPLMPESVRLLQNFVDIEVPVIAAVNGPCTVHAEIPVLADIVVAADNAYFADGFHFINGVVPGDGAQIVWPLMLGHSRAKYFLMTGERVSAEEGKRLGFVHEIKPASQVLARAWELAREIAKQPDVTLRATRFMFTRPVKRALADDLTFGLALEGLGNSNHWPLKLRDA